MERRDKYYKRIWINVNDELPMQGFDVQVKNGSKVFDACYYRKKWHSDGRILHKVTHWNKCPISYPKIPAKDLKGFMARAKKYRNQMQPRMFTCSGAEVQGKLQTFENNYMFPNRKTNSMVCD